METIDIDYATLFLDDGEIVVGITLPRAAFDRLALPESFVPDGANGHWLKRSGATKFWCNDPPVPAGRPS